MILFFCGPIKRSFITTWKYLEVPLDGMTRESEYMEAFFGVELNQKFIDCINEIREVEDNLKELSRNIAKFLTPLPEEDLKNSIKESRASAYELSQQLKDARSFLEFYLKSDQSSTHIILERDTYMKIYQIFKWDGHDVRDLKGWIRELRELCSKIGLHTEDLLDFSKLTARPVPDDVKKYPVYAVDRQGYCLTGPQYDRVIHIEEIREEMAGGPA
jgi:hypothetical protein